MPLRPPADPPFRSLPRPRTPLIGRIQEIGEIATCLDNHALVTLTGSGGIGKTRLAIAVANEVKDEYADGVWFADLTQVSDPGGVVNRVASLFGVQAAENQALMTLLVDHLQNKTLLLVLDNCEHLVEACAHFVEILLVGCPNLRLLATSRQHLGITGERVWQVNPLLRPDPHWLCATEKDRISACMEYDAIRLFVERAQAAYPAFRLTAANSVDVMQIAWMLEGIPFAIELAAAWVRVLTVDQIAVRMDDQLAMLIGGSRTKAQRQWTVRAMLDWSYNLLTEPEKRLLCALSVFTGGWTVEAAESVCVAEDSDAPSVLSLLASLADKSLLVYEDSSGQARSHLLETTRAYARDKLDVYTQPDLLRRHADYYLRQAEDSEAKRERQEKTTELDQIETEYANLRAALDWNLNALQHDTRMVAAPIENGLRLALALYPLWQSESSIDEGRRILTTLLAGGEAAPLPLRAKSCYHAGRLAFMQSSHQEACDCFEKSLSMAKTIGNSALETDSLCQLGVIAWDTGDNDSAHALLTSGMAIHERSDNREGQAVALSHLGIVARRQGDLITARSLSLKSLELCRENEDKYGMAYIIADKLCFQLVGQ